MKPTPLRKTKAALKTAMETLNQIALMPRQRRARGLALATVGFLETQMKNTP